MGQPEITAEQREMAVTLLANALRKDAHLRARAERPRREESPLQAGVVTRRAAPSQRYVDGMCALLHVLFVDGAAVAEACLAEARARAMGDLTLSGTKTTTTTTPRANGRRDT